ncbi:MAG TPA: FCD domain-containing protein [Actinomycetota bacterium]|nr:FCD domain-containing protein [Actinomycetota bacterium]
MRTAAQILLSPPGNGRQSAVDQARTYIEALIDLRRVKPGDRLPSAAAFADEVGVSRPAVLQALKILEAQGRVIVRPGRGGTWVAEHEPENLDTRLVRAWEHRDTILQMAVLREILEPGVVRLVAERGMSAEHTRAAEDLLAQMEACEPYDVEGYRGRDNEFHLLLARATGLKLIESVTMLCRAQVAAAFDVMEVPEDRRTRSDAEHREIVKAIKDGDADVAAEVVRRHVGETTILLQEQLSGPQHPVGRRVRAARQAMRRKGEGA